MDTLPALTPLTDAELDLVTGGHHAGTATGGTVVNIIEISVGSIVATDGSKVVFNIDTSGNAGASVGSGGKHHGHHG